MVDNGTAIAMLSYQEEIQIPELFRFSKYRIFLYNGSQLLEKLNGGEREKE